MVALGCAGDQLPDENLPARSPATATITAPRWNEIEYTMWIYPLEGRVVLTPKSVDAKYDNFQTGTQGSGSGQIELFTPQSTVSYIDKNGSHTCHGSGCTSLSGICSNQGVFCADLQLKNHNTFALPDVIVQLAQRSNQQNAISSCGNGTGRCAADTTDAHKVDDLSASGSSLTSPISGCSYCYGNASKLSTSILGLRDAVLPYATDSSTTMLNLNTDHLALNLSNDHSFGTNIVVKYPTPNIDNTVTLSDGSTTPNCATVGSTLIKVTGTALGPNASCTSATNCPTSGGIASGYTMTFIDQSDSSVVASTSVTWSDTAVQGALVSTAATNATYKVKLTTPLSSTGVMPTATFTSCRVGTATQFALDITGNPRVGHSNNLKITAEDASGTKDSSYNSTVTISVTSGVTLATMTDTLSGGMDNINGEISCTTSGTKTVTVSGPSALGGTITSQLQFTCGS